MQNMRELFLGFCGGVSSSNLDSGYLLPKVDVFDLSATNIFTKSLNLDTRLKFNNKFYQVGKLTADNIVFFRNMRVPDSYIIDIFLCLLSAKGVDHEKLSAYRECNKIFSVVLPLYQRTGSCLQNELCISSFLSRYDVYYNKSRINWDKPLLDIMRDISGYEPEKKQSLIP